MLDRKLKRRLEKLIEDDKENGVTCIVCGERLDPEDADQLEYAKTRRGTEVWWHTDCTRKWGG